MPRHAGAALAAGALGGGGGAREIWPLPRRLTLPGGGSPVRDPGRPGGAFPFGPPGGGGGGARRESTPPGRRGGGCAAAPAPAPPTPKMPPTGKGTRGPTCVPCRGLPRRAASGLRRGRHAKHVQTRDMGCGRRGAPPRRRGAPPRARPQPRGGGLLGAALRAPRVGTEPRAGRAARLCLPPPEAVLAPGLPWQGAGPAGSWDASPAPGQRSPFHTLCVESPLVISMDGDYRTS